MKRFVMEESREEGVPDVPPTTAQRLAPPRQRGMVRGFVGTDGKTHAIELTIQNGATLEFYFVARDRRTVSKPDATQCAFIANPKAPLCMNCVRAIEAEIQREKE